MTTKSSITQSQTSEVLKKLNLNDSQGDVFAALNKLLNSPTISSDKSINDDMKDVQLFKTIILSHTIFFSLSEKHEDLCLNLTESAFLDQLATFLSNKGSVEDKSTIDILNMIYTLLVNCTFKFDWFCAKVYNNRTMMKILRDNIKLGSGNREENVSGILYDSISIIFNILRQKVEYRDGSDMKDIGGVLLEFIKIRKEKQNYFQMMCFICFCLIESPKKSEDYADMSHYIVLLRETRDRCKNDSGEIYRNFTLRELEGIITHLNSTVSWVADELSTARLAVAINVSKNNKDVDEEVKYEWDVFLSYCHKNTAVVDGIYKCLKDNDYKVWRDTEEMKGFVGSTSTAMCEGINKSKLFLSALSSHYEKSEDCIAELEFAKKKGKVRIYVKVEENYTCNDSCQLILGLSLYVKYKPNQIEKFHEEILAKIKSASGNK